MTGAGTDVTSSAAMGVLKLPKQPDILLELVSKLASSNGQLEVMTTTSGQLELHLHEGQVVLMQRNAILRALAGYGLLFAIDQAPLYWCGGHAQKAVQAKSVRSANVMGALSRWMSIVNNNDHNQISELLPELDQVLQEQSFLLGTAMATLADYDVALFLLQQPDLPQQLSTYRHLDRWLRTVDGVLQSYGQRCNVTVPSYTAQAAPPLTPAMFYYGTEDTVADAMWQQSAPKGGSNKNKGITPLPSSSTKNSATAGATATETEKKSKAAGNQKQPAAETGTAPATQPKGGGGSGSTTDDNDVNISALDIRVGKITKVWHHAEADKLFCEEINVGNANTRQVASGLRAFYSTNDLQDRLVLVLCNLKKRNLVGFASHGMVLCASSADHTVVQLITPPPDSVVGERVMFGDHAGEPEAENKVAKKKIFERLAPQLQTNEQGLVHWNGALAKTSAGVVTSEKLLANAQVA